MNTNKENKNNEITNKIIEIIEKIKPFLESDGGDLEFIKYENNKILKF